MNTLFAPEPCPVCGDGTWKPYCDGTHEFRHGRRSHFVGGQHYALCDKCGTMGYLPGQRDANRLLMREYQNALPGYISPSDVLALREKYLLTQEQAGLIFGGGKQGFSKWECGKASPAGPTARLIRLALKLPDAMSALAAEAGIQLREKQSHDRRITDKNEQYFFEPSIVPVIRVDTDSFVLLRQKEGEKFVAGGSGRLQTAVPVGEALKIPMTWVVIVNAARSESTSVSGQPPIRDDASSDEPHPLH
jgi:HTH-type transcriptional regulator / antitoxin MqsA